MAPLGLSRLLIKDFDLAAELAMTELLVGDGKPDAGMRTIASALGTQFAALGYIPSPTFDRTDYHTTFVFGILCSLVRFMATPDEQLIQGLSRREGELPPEWDGRQLGLVTVAEQIGHTFQAWIGIADKADEAQLLRHVIDVYLLRAISSNSIDDMKALFGMARVAGVSPIHASGWRLLQRRARLSGYELPADPLQLKPLCSDR